MRRSWRLYNSVRVGMEKNYGVRGTPLTIMPLSHVTQSAIALLNSRRRTARPSLGVALGTSNIPALDSMPSLNGAPSMKGTPSLVGMKGWLQELGHSVSISIRRRYRQLVDQRIRKMTSTVSMLYMSQGRKGRVAHVLSSTRSWKRMAKGPGFHEESDSTLPPIWSMYKRGSRSTQKPYRKTFLRNTFLKSGTVCLTTPQNPVTSSF